MSVANLIVEHDDITNKAEIMLTGEGSARVIAEHIMSVVNEIRAAHATNEYVWSHVVDLRTGKVMYS